MSQRRYTRHGGRAHPKGPPKSEVVARINQWMAVAREGLSLVNRALLTVWLAAIVIRACTSGSVGPVHVLIDLLQV